MKPSSLASLLRGQPLPAAGGARYQPKALAVVAPAPQYVVGIKGIANTKSELFSLQCSTAGHPLPSLKDIAILPILAGTLHACIHTLSSEAHVHHASKRTGSYHASMVDDKWPMGTSTLQPGHVMLPFDLHALQGFA